MSNEVSYETTLNAKLSFKNASPPKHWEEIKKRLQLPKYGTENKSDYSLIKYLDSKNIVQSPRIYDFDMKKITKFHSSHDHGEFKIHYLINTFPERMVLNLQVHSDESIDLKKFFDLYALNNFISTGDEKTQGDTRHKTVKKQNYNYIYYTKLDLKNEVAPSDRKDVKKKLKLPKKGNFSGTSLSNHLEAQGITERTMGKPDGFKVTSFYKNGIFYTIDTSLRNMTIDIKAKSSEFKKKSELINLKRLEDFILK
jgi:hypothetical protein